MNKYLEAVKNLHTYLINNHWNGQALVGADPIGKVNWRITRFVRNYTRWLPWPNNLVYLQGLSYWIKSNLHLANLTEDDSYLDIVESSADYIIKKQLENGIWEHPPIRERRGYISAVESIWAGLGLVSAYKQLKKPSYLEVVEKTNKGLVDSIGLHTAEGSLSLNYYAHTTYRVPNITTMYLWLLAETYRLTNNTKYLENCDQLVLFIKQSQMENGELHYVYNSWPHFQSYQYNSFQFLDLAHYYELTGDENMWPIIKNLATFLKGGVTEQGSSRYDNFKERPEVNYWTGALANALGKAHEMGLGDYAAISERGYNYLLTQQKKDGGFGYSKYNYKILRDDNSYPRYLSMILKQLLYRVQVEVSERII